MITKNLKSYKCICCGFEIKPVQPELFDKMNSEINHWMWDGGVVTRINMPYGSSLDGDSYFIAICDNCVEKLHKEGKALYIEDYISNKIFKENYEKE
jgi:hypothetical protein